MIAEFDCYVFYVKKTSTSAAEVNPSPVWVLNSIQIDDGTRQNDALKELTKSAMEFGGMSVTVYCYGRGHNIPMVLNPMFP